MAKEILKRLTYSFLLTLLISISYAWNKLESTTGNEARQGMFIWILIVLILCTLNFISSLLALLNLNTSIRQNFWKSLLSFIFLPSVLLLVLLVFFLIDNHIQTISEFLIIGHIPIIYIAVLTFHFYRFKRTLV